MGGQLKNIENTYSYYGHNQNFIESGITDNYDDKIEDKEDDDY